MNTLLRTSQGSVYTVFPDNRTKRFKEVSGESFDKSDRTVYVEENDAYFLIGAVSLGLIRLAENQLQILTNDRVVYGVDYVTEAKIGLHPVELWGELRSPTSVHIGNAIINKGEQL